MVSIATIHAREVLDSRGNPTVEAEVRGSDGSFGRAIAPSGASTGTHEAHELRDGDKERYGGKGVLAAVGHVVDVIAPALAGRPLLDQSGLDGRMRELDGSEKLDQLGANAVLAVSLAAAHAAADHRRVPLYQSISEGHASLPLPMVNMISGGLHAGRQVEFQDFLILPVGAASYRQALEWIVAVYRSLGRVLAEHGYEAALVGDEGGYGPKLRHNREAVEFLLRAIEQAGRTPGEDIALALDVASTHFYRDGRYWLKLGSDAAVDLDSDAMIELLSDWVTAFPILSIEDALAEDDWDGWRKLTAVLGDRVQLIGDDLLVTNPQRLARCIAGQHANGVLIKPNQIGTLTDTLAVARQAQEAGFWTIVSARSGETEDTTIADLAVGVGAGQIKIGSIVRSERLAKYNQLLRIAEASDLAFAAGTVFERLRGRG
jgi:enolase